ncbi:2-dehydro-3-deoxygalactonokinase [Jannaschia sp. LMIT008]|uniref:2-dehydro-3-deoxygalactonokinase n=1 Tax=Jannaschia maritima TaxID=3032585 RepID=UPI002812788B|nr:2-dehydro-3-deoxygalactonokinase [Jannaschia sp. LMIT008]
MTDPWIAVDWGTSTLRATRMDGYTPRDTRESDAGMGGLARDGFQNALISLVEDWLDRPTDILACGMVGARQGWHEAPYRTVPATPAGGAVTVPGTDPRLRVRILPGLSQTDPHPDVMRGEETQISGILTRLDGFDGCACLPGTHTKWVHLSAGEVVSFRTVMTGELFAALTRHSVLRHSIAPDGWDDDAFAEAVDATLSRPETLTAKLFQLRAADLLHAQPAAVARATLSGLLIGAELAATKPWWLGREVVITGSATTTPAYDKALTSQGISTHILSAADATLAGLAVARRTCR